MTVVPVDEGARADHARQCFSGNSQTPIARRPGCQDNRIVERQQFTQTHIATDFNVPEKAVTVARQNAIEDAGHGLGALMIGSDTVANQAEGHRQLLENIDGRVRHQPQQMVRKIAAGRPRADDSDVFHGSSN